MIPRLRSLAGATAGLILALPLGAQTDEQILASYRLTEARLTAFVHASRNLVNAAKADPALIRNDEENDDEENDNPSITGLAAYYDSRPAVKRAITSAGMSSRDYVTFMLAMFQAGVASYIVKQSEGQFDRVPAGIPHDNIRFYQQHEAELERISQELRALSGDEENEAEEDG
jgi:hypothetical protein